MVKDHSYKSVLTTLKGLKGSILTDKYVYRWFLFLIQQPSFKKRGKGIEDIERAYARIDRIVLRQWILNGLIALLITICVLANDTAYVIALLLAFYLQYRNLSDKKKNVAQIGVYFLEKDFPEDEMQSITLYQIGEIYGQRYGILTLVDSLYHLDKIYRFTFLFSFLLVGYIIVTDMWIIKVLVFLVFYYAVYFIVNSSFGFRRFD